MNPDEYLIGKIIGLVILAVIAIAFYWLAMQLPIP